MKNNKGITLIALVITIIVLLILAGVSIAMLTGDNGILTQAKSAQNKTKISSIAENVQMGIGAAYSASQDPTQSVTFDINSIVAEVIKTSGKTASDITGSGNTILYKYSDSETYTVTLKTDLKSIDTNADGTYKITK